MHRGKGMKFVGDSRVPAMRKPNIPKDYSEYPGKTEAFWPNFLLKEWMVGSVFLIGFLCLTVAHPSPLERIADPTDTSYIPLPDWYFLFLYQLLKYSFASGPYTVVGAIIIPGLAFGALLLAPFLDRGPERRPSKRPVAVGMMLLTLAAIIFLTWESVVTHDWEAAAEQGKIRAEVDIDKNAEGYKILEANTCLTCHGENLQGGPAAPSLVGTGLSPEEIANIAKNGKGGMPAGIFKGTDEELQKLAEFVAGLKAE
ncbi:c-type cytochrome [Anoxybacillus salavatliensis]|uniref:Menaquinol:cytochrome c reductase cytochrome c subunit n=2 Tax=Anoxybacillus flavithermus TaxID=33934 RepID=A0A2G5RQB6_9BACL|nr:MULTISPECIES: menaquinol-cytochrome c reductase cytochrome b/c subunit [Anoxybacillus]KFZ41843.1 cytochrome Cbb3 [Anoxybacillus sp. KU2-6(11)]MBA2879189.1 menaquinol-cytochrome c reductase cytochrome b/c subunit [Anoxybacillus ayderensis]MCQ5364575.1 c-type cytochrome [Anoxybacillus gonensis]MED0687369.1 c-type cytochrome [Anoxybacillus ayderensis]PIC04893.1 cytochrome C oxidase Cbb3 [Anoxybacillus flavithermus]